VNNGDDHTVGCADCDYSATEAHSYEGGVCVCGAEEAVVDEYLDEGLTIMAKSLSFESYISVDYVVNNNVAKNYDSYYVAVSVAGGEEKVLEALPVAGTTIYNLFNVEVAPAQIASNLRATIYAVKDGVTYHGTPVDWSVREAAMSTINTSTNPGRVRLLVDMLNYGAQAQIRFGVSTNDLANNQLTPEQQALGTQENPTIAGEVTQTSNGVNAASFYMTGLALESAIETQFIMRATGYSAEQLELRITYGNTVETFDVDPVAGTTGYFTVFYRGMKIPQQRQPFSATIYDKATGLPLSVTQHLSIEALLVNTHAQRPDLANAAMKFGDSAQEYFGYVIQ
jgi:hypothetical protein